LIPETRELQGLRFTLAEQPVIHSLELGRIIHDIQVFIRPDGYMIYKACSFDWVCPHH